jgi:hypothetical protein
MAETAPRVEILVARYREPVAWTGEFGNVTIYNKGSPLNDARETMLENVGREGHTYARFICDRYDSLPEYLVCLQGNPFDHCPMILSKLREFLKPGASLPEFAFLCSRILRSNLAHCPTGSRFRGGIPLIPVYEELFGERKERMPFTFGAGAQFIVSRDRILRRPREFYQKIVDMLGTGVDPIEGYVIERFQGLIFGGEGK